MSQLGNLGWAPQNIKCKSWNVKGRKGLTVKVNAVLY